MQQSSAIRTRETNPAGTPQGQLKNALRNSLFALALAALIAGMAGTLASEPPAIRQDILLLADGEGDPHEEKEKEDFVLPLPWPFLADGEGDPHEEKEKEDSILPLPWPFQVPIG